jgi:hypothetical protein
MKTSLLYYSGDIDPAHPIFQDSELGPIIVATTASGREKLVSRVKMQQVEEGYIISEPQRVSETAEVTVVSYKTTVPAATVLGCNGTGNYTPTEESALLLPRMRILVILSPEDAADHSAKPGEVVWPVLQFAGCPTVQMLGQAVRRMQMGRDNNRLAKKDAAFTSDLLDVHHGLAQLHMEFIRFICTWFSSCGDT